MQHAADNMQQTTCSRQHAADNMQQTTCSRQHAADNLFQQRHDRASATYIAVGYARPCRAGYPADICRGERVIPCMRCCGPCLGRRSFSRAAS
jgi:hypothetical protein